MAMPATIMQEVEGVETGTTVEGGTGQEADDPMAEGTHTTVGKPALGQYNRYRDSKEYGDIVNFLLGGVQALRERKLGASQIKNVRRKAGKYRLIQGGVLRQERNGLWAKCVLPDAVSSILKHLHDGYGHFADAITMDRAVGQFYWPKWARDIENWCRQCPVC